MSAHLCSPGSAALLLRDQSLVNEIISCLPPPTLAWKTGRLLGGRNLTRKGATRTGEWYERRQAKIAKLLRERSLVTRVGVLMSFGVGPLALHMGQHIILMNVVALAAAGVLARQRRDWFSHHPVVAAIAQIVLIWGWHAPPVLAATINIWALHALMQISLFLIALWFWRALLAVSDEQRWLPVALLLVTSKLFCLLGVLLVFAGRDLYELAGHAHGVGAEAGLADQQLAGLLMIIACPLSYLSVGVFFASRWVGLIERQSSHG